MIWFALENTDSISTNSIGSVGNSGLITRLTRKCFCLANGMTAVHLVNKSFLGFSGFIEMTLRPCSQSLTLAGSFHHIDGLSFNPCHKALDTRVSQQGLNRVQVFGQFRLGKQRMNLAVMADYSRICRRAVQSHDDEAAVLRVFAKRTGSDERHPEDPERFSNLI